MLHCHSFSANQIFFFFSSQEHDYCCRWGGLLSVGMKKNEGPRAPQPRLGAYGTWFLGFTERLNKGTYPRHRCERWDATSLGPMLCQMPKADDPCFWSCRDILFQYLKTSNPFRAANPWNQDQIPNDETPSLHPLPCPPHQILKERLGLKEKAAGKRKAKAKPKAAGKRKADAQPTPSPPSVLDEVIHL